MSDAAPVLLTGATGFLGHEIALELARAGRAVHALAREGSDRGPVDAGVARWHTGDLLEPESLRRAVGELRDAAGDGPADLVHAAAVISYRTSDAALQWRANVEATEVLLDAARAAGLRRFLHVSSVVAVGGARSAGETTTEDAPFDLGRLGVDYVDTKRAAEERVLAEPERAGTEVVVVAPGAVFGATHRETNTGRFLETLVDHPLAGLLAPPGGLSVVGVRDVARGARLALERGRAERRYLLCESNRSLAELYAEVFRRAGRGRVLATLPRPAWSAVCAGAALVDRLRPLGFATPQALRLLGATFRTSSARARSELGWSPRPFDEVLDEALEEVLARRSPSP